MLNQVQHDAFVPEQRDLQPRPGELRIFVGLFVLGSRHHLRSPQASRD
jgi:hypothetical protein